MKKSGPVLTLLLCCVAVLSVAGCGATSTNAWINLKPAGDLPSARYSHSMAYDSASGQVILFGGWDGSTDFNDTWAYGGRP